MRILAMRLPSDWDEPLLDAAIGESVLPSSLVMLGTGVEASVDGDGMSILTALLSDNGGCENWHSSLHKLPANAHQNELCRLMRDVGGDMHSSVKWSVPLYKEACGSFNQSIPLDALPPHLRILQLNDVFNKRLQRGSIPDTVEVLQFGERFDRALDVGHLPSSLVQLNFGECFNQRLLPGVLPAGLKRLHLGRNYNQPLQPGALPSQLEELCLGWYYNHPLPPGVIPASMRYLCFPGRFNHPLSEAAYLRECITSTWAKTHSTSRCRPACCRRPCDSCA